MDWFGEKLLYCGPSTAIWRCRLDRVYRQTQVAAHPAKRNWGRLRYLSAVPIHHYRRPIAKRCSRLRPGSSEMRSVCHPGSTPSNSIFGFPAENAGSVQTNGCSPQTRPHAPCGPRLLLILARIVHYFGIQLLVIARVAVGFRQRLRILGRDLVFQVLPGQHRTDALDQMQSLAMLGASVAQPRLIVETDGVHY